MYEAHFGLAELPFRTAPDSRFYVDAAPHRAAIRAMVEGLQRGDEFMPLIGEFGVGKTTVARRMLEEVDRTSHLVGELSGTRTEGDDVLAGVAEALGMRDFDGAHPLGDLILRLEGLVREGRDALLLVDEAHQLGVDALKRLRKLTAVRVDGLAALHVYLVGRSMPPAVEELQRIGLPLNIGAPVRLEPLDSEGTREYILERLGHAGWTGRPAFDEDTTAEIHARCQGNPGRVNRLCGHILLQLYMQGRDDVNADVVRAVDELLQSELRGEPATLTLPPLAHASPDPVTPAKAQPAVEAGSSLYFDTLMASTTGNNLPALRPPHSALVVPAPQATSGSRGAGARRSALAQGVAALALLACGGFLWEAISGRLTASRWEQAQQAAAPSLTALPGTTALPPQAAPPPSPIPAAAVLAAVAERTVAQSPTGAGPSAPAAAALTAEAVAAAVPVRLPEPRHAAGASHHDRAHRRALPEDESQARSTTTGSAPSVAAAVCTLEGETLGLCRRSRAREPVRVAAPEPELAPLRDPLPEAVAAPAPRPACEPTHAALGLCAPGTRAAP